LEAQQENDFNLFFKILSLVEEVLLIPIFLLDFL